MRANKRSRFAPSLHCFVQCPLSIRQEAPGTALSDCQAADVDSRNGALEAVTRMLGVDLAPNARAGLTSLTVLVGTEVMTLELEVVMDPLVVGRVGMWRGGVRSTMSVAAPFVWRCLSGSAITSFPHLAHRTQQADFPHCALGQDLTPSPTTGRGRAGSDVRARSTRRGARVDSSRACVACPCA
jgi:hypothetical protein